jgi:hypothetical protein
MSWEPNYSTTSDLAEFVRIGDSADDAQLSLAISTASRAIDRACDRQFGQLPTAAARFYTARWDCLELRWFVDVDDLMTTVDLAVAADTVGDGDYDTVLTGIVTHPINAAADQRPWTRLVVRPSMANQPAGIADGVRVTARWGWDQVPPAIEQATLLQASRLLARRDSPFGVAGSPETGSEVRLLARLDPDVAIAVRPYRRMWGAI